MTLRTRRLTAPFKPTTRMRALEETHGQPIREILRDHYYGQQLTLEQMADVLATPPGTLANWMIRLELNRAALSAKAALEETA